MKKMIASAAVLGALLPVAAFLHAQGNRPAPQCKISPVEAIRLATQKAPGRALNANFEFAEGHWVYAVLVVNGKSIKEVEIDPMSGKVGDVETVTPDGEAKEVKAELMVAIGGKAPVEKDEDGKRGGKR